MVLKGHEHKVKPWPSCSKLPTPRYQLIFCAALLDQAHIFRVTVWQSCAKSLACRCRLFERISCNALTGARVSRLVQVPCPLRRASPKSASGSLTRSLIRFIPPRSVQDVDRVYMFPPFQAVSWPRLRFYLSQPPIVGK